MPLRCKKNGGKVELLRWEKGKFCMITSVFFNYFLLLCSSIIFTLHFTGKITDCFSLQLIFQRGEV